MYGAAKSGNANTGDDPKAALIALNARSHAGVQSASFIAAVGVLVRNQQLSKQQ
jgi:hypothetical protein